MDGGGHGIQRAFLETGFRWRTALDSCRARGTVSLYSNVGLAAGNVWPSIVPMLTRLNLDLDSALIDPTQAGQSLNRRTTHHATEDSQADVMPVPTDVLDH
jgi:hypothetical protein